MDDQDQDAGVKPGHDAAARGTAAASQPASSALNRRAKHKHQRSTSCPARPSSSFTAPGTAAGAGGRYSDLLERQGHKVFTPTLTGLGERSHLLREGINVSHPHHRRRQCAEMGRALDHVVLCGHSYGGLVVSGVAECQISATNLECTFSAEALVQVR